MEFLELLYDLLRQAFREHPLIAWPIAAMVFIWATNSPFPDREPKDENFAKKVRRHIGMID